jgi:hypothetical protein
MPQRSWTGIGAVPSVGAVPVEQWDAVLASWLPPVRAVRPEVAP